jgi:hypothetical protein
MNMNFSVTVQISLWSGQQKKLNISLNFKFDLCNSNYFKSMKLNFVLLNQELTKRTKYFLNTLRFLCPCMQKKKLPRLITNHSNFRRLNKKTEIKR